MGVLKKIVKAYYRLFCSPEAYARHIGVKIGKNCLISTRNWSSEPYLITIGDNVQVTSNVYFHTHGGAHVARGEHPNFDLFGKIVVEDGAYIGALSQIMPGVTIGRGALVASGSIVTKSVAAGTVVGGNPAKYICTVSEYVERNMPYNLDSKYLSWEQKRDLLLSLTEDKFLKK